MAPQKQQHRDRWRSGQVFHTPRQAESSALWRPRIPGSLLSRACHTLPWGILVVSAQGSIDFYNRDYAQLRGISPGALLGQPIAMLDRRHRLQELLHTGILPPERMVPDERRKNHEIILPLRDDDWGLIGAVVVIAGADWRLNGIAGSSSRQVSPRVGGKASEFGDEAGVGASPPTVQENPSVAGATSVSDNHDARCGGAVQMEPTPRQEAAGQHRLKDAKAR